MRSTLFFVFGILLLFLPRSRDSFSLSWSFAPAPVAAARKTVRFGEARGPGAGALRYKTKDQDAIAHEIIDVGGGESSFHKSSSHDHNPWKALLGSKKAKSPGGPSELAALVRPAVATTKAALTVESLQQDLFSLFQIAQQLTATELELVDQLADMERERDSVRWLVRRIFVVLKDRLLNRVRGLFRLGKRSKKEKEGSK
jgi:hypothetical protein